MANGKYWNEKIETVPVPELRKHQLGKLKVATIIARFTGRNSKTLD